jgi:hypothetical protein
MFSINQGAISAMAFPTKIGLRFLLALCPTMVGFGPSRIYLGA